MRQTLGKILIGAAAMLEEFGQFVHGPIPPPKVKVGGVEGFERQRARMRR